MCYLVIKLMNNKKKKQYSYILTMNNTYTNDFSENSSKPYSNKKSLLPLGHSISIMDKFNSVKIDLFLLFSG